MGGSRQRSDSEPRIVLLDIETSPGVGDIWGLWQQNVGLPQLREVTRMICVAWKELGKKKTQFLSEWEHGHEEMVLEMWHVINDADVVVHFNGASFDMKHLNREFLLMGLPKPSPVKQLDLLMEIKKNFKFMSNKLQHVSEQLLDSTKVPHTGHQLWTDVLAGRRDAQRLMKKYNIQDVVLMEELLERLGSWVTIPLSQGLTGDVDSCPGCGSMNLQKRGFVYTTASKFQRYVCLSCNRWSKSNKRIGKTGITGI